MLAAMLLLCGCIGDKGNTDTTEGQEQSTDTSVTVDQRVIFENGEYKAGFVYSALSDTEVTALRNELSRAFKAKTGIMPSFKKDEVVDNDEATFEVVFGQTDRPASKAPEGVDEKTDAYYFVGFVGNKLVINGSDSRQLALAVDYFVENYLAGDKEETLYIPEDIEGIKVLKDYTRPLWDLPTVPAYPMGTNNAVQANVYNCGTTIQDYATQGKTENSCELQMITKTNINEFSEYVTKLESFGFTKEYENAIDENYYVGMTDGEQRVYLTLNGKLSRAKVVVDPSGMSLDEFNYTYTPKAGERSEYYLYAIPMSNGLLPENGGSGKAISGMFMIIKCADNSVIIIDGGDGGTDETSTQMNSEAYAALDVFLKEITNTPEGGKVRISAWYVTHYHSDHIYGFMSFLKAYGDDYELERIFANIPTDDAVVWWDGMDWTVALLKELRAFVNSKYPNCKELKVHTGQVIRIADVKLEILYTHEDNLTNAGKFNSTNSNDTCVVAKADNGLMTMLVVGDINTGAETVINTLYEAATVKVDIFQASHHMMYPLERLEKRVDPKVIYIPQNRDFAGKTGVLWAGSSYTWVGIRDSYYAMVGAENCYFGGSETVGYAVVDGVLTRIYYSDTVHGMWF